VEVVEPLGPETLLVVKCRESSFLAMVDSEVEVEIGQTIFCILIWRKCIFSSPSSLVEEWGCEIAVRSLREPQGRAMGLRAVELLQAAMMSDEAAQTHRAPAHIPQDLDRMRDIAECAPPPRPSTRVSSPMTKRIRPLSTILNCSASC